MQKSGESKKLEPTPAHQKGWIQDAFRGLEPLPIEAIASANIGLGVKLRIYISRKLTQEEFDAVDLAITEIHAATSCNEQLPFADFEFVSYSQEMIEADKKLGYTLVDFPEQADAT